MSDTFTGSSNTDWFNSRNWTSVSGNKTTHKAPVNSATGSQGVVISGKTAVISPVQSYYSNYNPTNIYVAQTLNTGGVNYTVLTETQIDGVGITLANGANLDIQGVALGIFYDNVDTLTPAYTTMTGLHGALTATPHADMHMQISVVGTDTLTVDTVNENFGFITIGNGDTLNLENITSGGNAQALHGLINYGILSVSSGGELNITATNASGSTLANFYNAGWIVDNGGTLSISSSVLDGASTLAANGGVDGFIEVGSGGLAILSNTVSSAEQVNFTDNSHNTLQITAGTLFSGTVNNFGSGNTIQVNGFTSTSNATLTTVGGVKELITTNGSVQTTITLTGSVSSNFSTTLSGGKEVISAGGNTLSGNTTYTSGSNTLTASSGSLTNTGTLAATGSGSTLAINSNVGGTGTIFIDNGATVALDNATGNDSGQTVLFGTNGSAASPNTLLVNDNSAGFGGPIAGFGVNDDIVLGGSALPTFATGDGVGLSFNSATGVLTVTETDSSGATLGSSMLTFTGASGLSTSSFVGLETSAGLDIELAPSSPVTYNFSASGTGSFEDRHNYTGGKAPGDELSAKTTVAIKAGTAAVSAKMLTDNGLITVSSGTGFVDAGTLAGTGKLVVSGKASLTGNTSLASITDGGSLVLGGTVSGPITISSGAQASVTGSLVDTGSLSGAGAFIVGAGNSATLSGGVSGISVTDNGSLTVAGNVSSNISGTGTLAVASGTSAALSGTDSMGALTSNGSLTVTGSLTDSGTASGTGALTVASGGNVTLAGGSALASITDNGSLTVAGSVSSNISGSGTLVVASGTSPTLSGTDSVGALVDNGTLTVTGSFTDNGTASGTGTLAVGTGGTATLAGGASLAGIYDAGSLTLGGAYTGSIDMRGNNTGSVADFTGPNVTSGVLNTSITDLGFGDTVALGSANFALSGSSDALSESYNSSTGVVTISDATNGEALQVTLGLTAGDSASLLHVTEVNGQVELTLCFYPGTALATPAGEVAVEALKAGDLVMTANGAMPVRWIGQNHIHTRFADPLRSLPIRIRQGALGDGLPVRDLLLSPDHAVYVDGILVHASALVNGTSIVREHNVPEQFTYYHVELATHELLLAEGVQAESFVDNVDRMHFHNWDERTAPETPVMEMDLPRAKSARQVPVAIRRRLELNQFAVA